ncbi:MAG: hypothetical protein PVJ57_17740 [Phycisphaerae bacterium]|jgi:hypothetical protein
MPTFYLGRKGHLYYGVEGVSPSAELLDIEGLTLDCDANTVSFVTRRGDGMETTVQVSRSCAVDFTLVKYPEAAAAYAMFRNAWRTGAPIALKILDETGEGPDGDFTVTKCSRKEDAGDVVKVDISVKIVSLRDWIGG